MTRAMLLANVVEAAERAAGAVPAQASHDSSPSARSRQAV